MVSEVTLDRMASLRLDVPENFDFRSPDDWPRWKKRFEQFRLAPGLVGESKQRQISTLLYCLSGDAEDVLGRFSYQQTLHRKRGRSTTKYWRNWKVQRNIIFERARFNNEIN